MYSTAERLIQQVSELRARALHLEDAHRQELEAIAPAYRDSARNLLHYLSLRQTDLRQAQLDLSSLGLSSLGGSEADVLSTLDAVLVALCRLAGRDGSPPGGEEPPVNSRTGPMLLQDHAQHLLGSPAGKRPVRIMVTMPSEAATDGGLVRALLAAGMDVMRINCAHDDRQAWTAMIANLREAERTLDRRCKICADLGGPKLRTGEISPVGRVAKFGPRRDYRGSVVAPAQVWLTPAEAPVPPPSGAAVTLPLKGTLIESALPGDTLVVADCRGKGRKLRIVSTSASSALATAKQTAYVEEGATARLVRQKETLAEGTIGPLPEVVLPIPLSEGDLLILTRSGNPGHPAIRDEQGLVVEPARIPCLPEEPFSAVRAGEKIWFDDGAIGGVVTHNDGDEMRVLITYAGPKGARLGVGKGINLPDTRLDIPSLTDQDREDLGFLVQHVDMVGLSYARSPNDVRLLQDEMQRLGAGRLGTVLKIETRQAFEQLPSLLLASLRSPPVGVMVARGDLATEVGFERLAEVQEEILWLCEAAHIPVIWATQVLENLAQRGLPSRAEVSDAAMSGRAECVMLNKGPYIVEAVRFLSGVLDRMQDHQLKKRPMLRKLAVSQLD